MIFFKVEFKNCYFEIYKNINILDNFITCISYLSLLILTGYLLLLHYNECSFEFPLLLSKVRNHLTEMTLNNENISVTKYSDKFYIV